MLALRKYIGDLFVTPRFYGGLMLCIAGFLLAFYVPAFQSIAFVLVYSFIILCTVDYIFLFFSKKSASATRITAGRLSNGDENKIELIIKNDFRYPISLKIIDELPSQFQFRNWRKELVLKTRQQKKIHWFLRPLQRGKFHFGNIHLFVCSPLKLLVRRITCDAAETVHVYPSFLQLHKYELLSQTFLQHEAGSSRMRKIGQSMEFEQIKEYVTGDDIRTLNWKASARRGGLMVNNFMNERSQQVYCIIDKGRLMKMPFDGLTLLDYAINSCLILSNVCLKKQDRVGLITFSHTIDSVLAADRKPVQKENIMQTLYNQTTDFLESDFEKLYLEVRNRIKHRSLLILFTNFESVSGLKRQIEYLRMLATHHLVLVIFFENTELKQLASSQAANIEEVYIKTIAGKFAFEKRLIAKELSKYGILSVLSTPQKLTINAINKFLELKARQAI
ncbi:MAG: DUF58 domain-containing protein [Ginsengibacter sp.]